MFKILINHKKSFILLNFFYKNRSFNQQRLEGSMVHEMLKVCIGGNPDHMPGSPAGHLPGRTLAGET